MIFSAQRAVFSALGVEPLGSWGSLLEIHGSPITQNLEQAK